MRKKIASTALILCLLFLCFLMMTRSKQVIDSVLFSLSIWRDHLFPTLFPFFILSGLLIAYGLPDFLGEILKKFMGKLFYLPGESAFVLGISMISGFPSSAKFTRELVVNQQLSEEEGSYLLTFTHFSNPLFVIGTIGSLLLQNQTLGFLILLAHMSSNFIIALLFRKKKNLSVSSVSYRRAFQKMQEKQHSSPSLGTILSNVIFDTMKTLMLLLGVVTIFLIITTLLDELFPLSIEGYAFLSGMLEMTQGVKNVSLLKIPLVFRAMAMAAIISFGGLSVHMQILSILSDTKIRYRSFFLARVLHALLAAGIVFFLYFIIRP